MAGLARALLARRRTAASGPGVRSSGQGVEIEAGLGPLRSWAGRSGIGPRGRRRGSRRRRLRLLRRRGRRARRRRTRGRRRPGRRGGRRGTRRRLGRRARRLGCRRRRRGLGRRRDRIGLLHRRGRGVVGRGLRLWIVGRGRGDLRLRDNGDRHRTDQRLWVFRIALGPGEEGERGHAQVQGDGSENGRARTTQGAQASGAVSVIRFILVKPVADSRAMTRATAW